MVGLAIHGVSIQKVIFGYVMGLGVHCVGCQAWLSQLPRHRNVARTVHTISIVGGGLTVGYFICDPVMGSCLDCLAIQAFEVGVDLQVFPITILHIQHSVE